MQYAYCSAYLAQEQILIIIAQNILGTGRLLFDN